MKSIVKLLLLLLPFCALAQKVPEFGLTTQRQADSLRNVVSTGKNDTLIMEACQTLGFYYYENFNDSAIHFFQNEYTLANKLALKMWEADSYTQLGILFYYKGDITKCYEYLTEAKAMAENEKNENSNWHLWNFDNAEDFHDARITILGEIYNGFGMLYALINEPEKSKIAYYEAIRLSKSIQDHILLSLTYGNLAREYDSDSLLLFSRKALQYQDKAGFHKYRGGILFQMAGTYFTNKQYDSAAIYTYASIAADKAQNILNDLSYSYSGVASFYINQHNTDSGFFYAKKLLSVAELTRNPNIFLSVYSTLANLYDLVNNVDSAYKYERLSSHLNDSLKSSKITQLTNYQTLAFNEQLRLEKLNNDKTAYQNKVKLYTLISGLAAVLLVAMVLYRNNLLKQKTNKVLQTTLTHLKSTQSQLIQSEKMASLGELTAGIAHEIQNPLNFVNNFSEVSNELLDEMNEELDKGDISEAKLISNDIKQNLEKINHHGKRADAIVKGMLQHSRQTKSVKEPTDINALCDEYLRLSYHGLRAKDKTFNADFKTGFDNSIGKINIVPQDMGRVFLNLFNNAFYAVNEKKKLSDNSYQPSVSVQTKKVKGKVEIIVKDNGSGIPQHIIDKIFQPFFTTKPTGQGTGLGLSLSYDIITKEHNGTIQVESKEGEGTAFIIQLPC